MCIRDRCNCRTVCTYGGVSSRIYTWDGRNCDGSWCCVGTRIRSGIRIIYCIRTCACCRIKCWTRNTGSAECTSCRWSGERNNRRICANCCVRPCIHRGCSVYCDRCWCAVWTTVCIGVRTVSYTHLRAHETVLDLVCRLLLEKKQNTSTLDALRTATTHPFTHTLSC